MDALWNTPKSKQTSRRSAEIESTGRFRGQKTEGIHTSNDYQRLGVGYSGQLVTPYQPIAFGPEICIVKGLFLSFEGFAETLH